MIRDKRKRRRIIVVSLVALLAVWILGDFFYSRLVAHRVEAWEASLEWNEEGVIEGREAFTLGDGETALLLIHGMNDSPHCWYKMAPALQSHGVTCRAMRLPGFAEGIDEYAQATRDDWLEAVEREAQALRDSHERVYLVGHSLGGTVTIAYLLEHPKAADGAVLIAPAIAISDRRSPIFSARFWHELGNRLLIFTRTTLSPFELDVHNPAARDYEGRNPFTPRSIHEETFALIDRIRGRASEFNLPLLMVLSKDDQVIDWRAAKAFFEQVESADKELYFCEDAGHAIPFDNGWRQVVGEIAEFIGR